MPPPTQRAGLSEEQRQALVNSCLRLAYSVANRAARRCPGADAENLEGEALLALNECSFRFDPARGISFSSWAYRAVEWHLSHLLERHWRAARRMHVVSLGSIFGSADGPESDGDHRAFEPLDHREPDPSAGAEQADELARITTAAAVLSPRQHFTLFAVLRDGRTYPEVAAALGISRARVEGLLHRAVKKLGPVLGDSNLYRRWRREREEQRRRRRSNRPSRAAPVAAAPSAEPAAAGGEI